MSEISVDLQSILPTLIRALAMLGVKVIAAIVVLVAGRFVAGWARSVVRKVLQRSGTDATLVPFLASALYYLIVAFVAIAVLGMVGIQTASLVAILGAAGLAIGLALQGALSNVAGGVMLLLFRPFRVGDSIEAGGNAGIVETIGLFFTTLTTGDNVLIIIPNARVYGGTLKNFSARGTQRNDAV